MKKEKKRISINLYYKVTLAMIFLGFFPMFILATFMSNSMLDEYREALVANYEQAAFHFSSSVENMLSVYDNIAKYVYKYDTGAQEGRADYFDTYDSLRQVLMGEIYDGQDRDMLREREMRLFQQSLESMDGYIYAVHFVTENEEIGSQRFHFSYRNKTISLIDRKGECFFSTREDYIGENLEEGLLPASSGRLMIINTRKNEYGLEVVIEVDTKEAFGRLNGIRFTMYGILGFCAVALFLASSLFSKRFTRPIRRMMEQMGQVENGNFKIELPVESHDEIGILSERFNQMSRELEKYIEQVCVAEIKKNEAELTALKSQIYPHFLYNTLEVIRMTALDNGDGQVSQMIEALSEQIHYLIGPMQDMVPLRKEIDIVTKYIYLLNCIS